MAAETPFGLSFGDPRRYMGQSPLAEIGKAAKSFLTGYAIQESGLEKYLNDKGVKKNQQGDYEYKAPAGAAVPPINPIASSGGISPDGVFGTNPMVAQPMTFSAPVIQNGAPPQDIGEQVLDNTWTGITSTPTGPISVQNPTDFNPFVPDTGNQVAMTGNEYQQTLGFGSSKDKAGKLMKIMGMG